MFEGFSEHEEKEERKHLDTLIINRLNTAYLLNQNTKKTVRPEMLYTLQGDRPKITITKEQIVSFFNKKDPVIENGKIRGYKDKNGNFEMVN